MIGSSPYLDPANDAGQRQTNQWLRSYAASKGLTYWDGYSLFQDGPTALARGLLSPDGVHLTANGHELAVSAMFSELGLGNLSTASQREGSRLASTIIRSVGGDGSLTITSPTNTNRGVVFQNEDGGVIPISAV
jgi:hypothetical protein